MYVVFLDPESLANAHDFFDIVKDMSTSSTCWEGRQGEMAEAVERKFSYRVLGSAFS